MGDRFDEESKLINQQIDLMIELADNHGHVLRYEDFELDPQDIHAIQIDGVGVAQWLTERGIIPRPWQYVVISSLYGASIISRDELIESFTEGHSPSASTALASIYALLLGEPTLKQVELSTSATGSNPDRFCTQVLRGEAVLDEFTWLAPSGR